MLSAWKREGTALRIFFPRPEASREFYATIGGLTASAVELVSASDTLGVELEGAEFNGDPNASPSSEYKAYLVCEFRTGERCYFYVPRLQLPGP